MQGGGGIHVELEPDSFRPRINKDNDYMMDRAAQKEGRYFSGVPGIAMQDASVQESMGPIQDRSKENLVSTDNAIIMARALLQRAANSLATNSNPPGLAPQSHRVRSATFVLPIGARFDQEMSDALIVKEGIAHTSI